jgi:hypothetical protein
MLEGLSPRWCNEVGQRHWKALASCSPQVARGWVIEGFVCLSAFVSLSGERDQIAEQTYGADSERLSVQRQYVNDEHRCRAYTKPRLADSNTTGRLCEHQDGPCSWSRPKLT